MSFSVIYPFVKLGLRWFSATAQCLKVKKAAGEVIDWSDRLECAITGLSGLESDLLPLLEKQDYKSRK